MRLAISTTETLTDLKTDMVVANNNNINNNTTQHGFRGGRSCLFVFMSIVVTVWGSVRIFVVYRTSVKIVVF